MANQKTIYPTSDFDVIPSEFWGSPVLRAKADNEGGSGVVAGELWCPGFNGNTYQKKAWNKVWIKVPYSGLMQPFTPGACEVRVSKSRSVDKKKRAGGDGSRITLHGIQPAEGEIICRIWTPQQYEMLKELWLTIFPGPQKVSKTVIREEAKSVTTASNFVGSSFSTTTIPNVLDTTRAQRRDTVTTVSLKDVTVPFDVIHPTFTIHKIKSVIFVGGEGPTEGRVKGEKIFTMKWVEFFLPTSANATNSPDASKTSVQPEGNIYDAPGSRAENTGPTAKGGRIE